MTSIAAVLSIWLLAFGRGQPAAAAVDLAYTINTHGHGPGLEIVHQSVLDQTDEPYGSCQDCPGNCVHIPGPPQLLIADLAQVPVGQTNLRFAVSTGGGGTYVQTGGWGADTHFCQGVSSASGPETGGDIRVPFRCFVFSAGISNHTVQGGHCECIRFPSGGCFVGCDAVGNTVCAHNDFVRLDVDYKRAAADTAKTCSQSGTSSVVSDGTWYPVASATCMQAPDTATAWDGEVHPTVTGTGVQVEHVMIQPGVNPNLSASPYANGPVLWARAKPTCPVCVAADSPEDYKQFLGAWAPKHLDCPRQDSFLCPFATCCSSRTFHQAGCAICCVADVVHEDPWTVNTELDEASSADPANPLISASGDINLDEVMIHYGFQLGKSISEDENEIMKEGLCQGAAVIAVVLYKLPGGDASDHFVVITGQEEVVHSDGSKTCEYTISDPGKSKVHAHLSDYPVWEIRRYDSQ